MIPVDPVNLADYAPFDPFSYYIHIIIGLVGWIGALAALASQKGSRRHILGGRLFMISTVVVSVTALILLSTRFAPPLFVAALTAVYAIATAFLALRPGTQRVRRTEYGLFAFELAMLFLFMAMAIPNIMAGNINPMGPLVISIIPIILLVGDINFFRNADRRPALRVRRHLARMIWAFIISVRAPLAEIYAELSIPVFFILFGPLVVAPLMIWFFLKKLPRSDRAAAPE